MNVLVAKAKSHFLKSFSKKKNPPYAYLPGHIEEAEKWAKRILKDHPEADKEVVLVAVWLHDIGQVVDGKNKDHAVESEKETRQFLTKLGLEKEKVEKIAFCVRTHRNKDVAPKTLEAKILAAADSVSHMTDICYIDMIHSDLKGEVLPKIERDYRDAGFFPKLKKEITPLYLAWKKLIETFPN